MNALGKILLFALIFVTFSSCLVHPRPWKHWDRRRHETHHYKRGNMVGGRNFWVRQR